MGLKKGQRKTWSSGSPRKTDRNAAVVVLWQEQWSNARIARAFGITRQRVGSILRAHWRSLSRA